MIPVGYIPAYGGQKDLERPLSSALLSEAGVQPSADI